MKDSRPPESLSRKKIYSQPQLELLRNSKKIMKIITSGIINPRIILIEQPDAISVELEPWPNFRSMLYLTGLFKSKTKD